MPKLQENSISEEIESENNSDTEVKDSIISQSVDQVMSEIFDKMEESIASSNLQTQQSKSV
jgi:hypothetical protein